MIFSIVLKAANVRIVPRSCASPTSRQDFQESIPSTSVPLGLFVASSLDAMLVTVHYVKEGIIDANVVGVFIFGWHVRAASDKCWWEKFELRGTRAIFV
jgi:hypothetical protein